MINKLIILIIIIGCLFVYAQDEYNMQETNVLPTGSVIDLRKGKQIDIAIPQLIDDVSLRNDATIRDIKKLPMGVVIDLRTGKQVNIPPPKLINEEHNPDLTFATYWQRLRIDSISGSVQLTGNNPNGNGSYYRSGTESRNVGGNDGWVWVVYVRGGFLRYRMFYDNILPYTTAICTTSWRIHGTTIGGVPRTMWWVSMNTLYYAHTSPAPGDRWQTWVWNIPRSYWQWDNHDDTLKVGIQDTSASVLWIRFEYGITYNVYLSGIEENINNSVHKPQFNISPNPVANKSIIEFMLPNECDVDLKIYDANGSEVATLVNSIRKAGHHKVTWNINNSSKKEIPNGVYFARLKAGALTITKKVTVVR